MRVLPSFKKTLFVTFILVALVAVILLGYFSYQYRHTRVKVYLSGQQLRLDFKVVPWEKQSLAQLLLEVGLDTQLLDGVSVGLDDQTRLALARFLPQEVALSSRDHKVSFQALHLNPFARSSSLEYGSEKYEFATQSARLNLKSLAGGGWHLIIFDPAAALSFATSTATIRTAATINSDLWNTAQKLDKIEVKVGLKVLEGEIIFK